jgi:hypothetical protein
MGGLIWLWQTAGAVVDRITGGGATNRDAMDDAVRKKRRKVMDAVVWMVGNGTIR